MRFELVTTPAGNGHDPRFDESLIIRAANKGPTASVWAAKQGLVVPRTYRRYERFDAACDSYAKQSWPVTVRLSGGGVVPQGPGIINLSLAYAVAGRPLDHSDSAYELICGIIQNALKKYGIATHPQAVAGSFCDGRYNLACNNAGAIKKIAGTAQLWRHIKPDQTLSGASVQIVLVHAIILAAIDCRALTERANLFEQEVGSDKRYDPACIGSLHACQPIAAYSPDQFTQSLVNSLIEQTTGI